MPARHGRAVPYHRSLGPCCVSQDFRALRLTRCFQGVGLPARYDRKEPPPSRRLGYARVSTYGQTLDAQLEQLRKAGCAKVYREKATGARPDRRELLKQLKALAPGDVVTVTRIDRLARSTFDLFAIVKQIADAKAQFRSLAEPWADTGTSTGRLMLAVLGGLADVERDLIRTRTAEGRTREIEGDAFERTRATTKWPFARASRTISRPVPPVAPKTRTFMFDLDLPWCERRGSRRHGLLGRREDVACGRRTRYVLRTLNSEVHPSCIHGLKHFFGRSGVALRDAELFERFRPPCTRDCKGFHVETRTSPNCSATSSALTIEPSSTTRCPDQAGPVKRVATFQRARRTDEKEG